MELPADELIDVKNRETSWKIIFKWIQTLVAVDIGVVTFCLLEGQYGWFFNTQFAFFPTMMIVIGSFIGYSNLVKKNIQMGDMGIEPNFDYNQYGDKWTLLKEEEHSNFKDVDLNGKVDLKKSLKGNYINGKKERLDIGKKEDFYPKGKIESEDNFSPKSDIQLESKTSQKDEGKKIGKIEKIIQREKVDKGKAEEKKVKKLEENDIQQKKEKEENIVYSKFESLPSDERGRKEGNQEEVYPNKTEPIERLGTIRRFGRLLILSIRGGFNWFRIGGYLGLIGSFFYLTNHNLFLPLPFLFGVTIVPGVSVIFLLTFRKGFPGDGPIKWD